ncbi:hypothetical protein B0H16DRAFT_1686140 [Mycena metata]|uniref:Uncharacterized protein n=1 Tax=Mycena metata TaxID=1033252 RepID=A0AAD7NPP3_9AGAR|nr:hypothetical protein B0H16DRAFT_1686140 [Mycena metata]
MVFLNFFLRAWDRVEGGSVDFRTRRGGTSTDKDKDGFIHVRKVGALGARKRKDFGASGRPRTASKELEEPGILTAFKVSLASLRYVPLQGFIDHAWQNNQSGDRAKKNHQLFIESRACNFFELVLKRQFQPSNAAPYERRLGGRLTAISQQRSDHGMDREAVTVPAGLVCQVRELGGGDEDRGGRDSGNEWIHRRFWETFMLVQIAARKCDNATVVSSSGPGA